MHLGGLCALLSLVALGTAQMPTPTPMPMPDDDDAPVATDSLETKYEGSIASQFRRDHFYCLGVGQSISDFPRTYTSTDASQNLPFQWAIFLQYPVLSYLDSSRKESLFRLIGDLVTDGATEIDDAEVDLTGFDYTNFCIAQVTHYRVSDYEESILVNVFFNNASIVFNPANLIGASIANFDAAFKIGFRRSEQGIGPFAGNVTMFEGRPALVVEPINEDPAVTQTELNKHPGVVGIDDRSKDPTYRAIFLNSYPRGTTIEEALKEDIEFAENPDPTNFGLEAGDIVFAVFGSIFLLVVGGLAVLGYCIHPFFLS